ncbi:hypothetical protein X975_26264, partial [Stegodyphus mimosarum]
MLFRILYSLVFAVIYFCFLLHHCRSQDENGVVSTNISQELIKPTPIMRHVNQSFVDALIQEANRAFVSNTSFDDLINDNDTQQMLLRYRERKRQMRIMTIQRDILLKLGLNQEPNVTARLSEEQRQILVQSYDRTLNRQADINDTSV